MRYWCDKPIAVTISGPGGVRDLAIPQPFARIGAHPDSDIVIGGPGVLKRSWYVHALPVGFFGFSLDLEEGDARPPGRWLSATDCWRIGDYEFRLAETPVPAAAAQPTGLDLLDRGPRPWPVFKIWSGQRLLGKRRLKATLNLLGRDSHCALKLLGPRVSSFHCVLYWDQYRLWCVNFSSGNGTLLNGERIDCAELLVHDCLEIGDFELKFLGWTYRQSKSAAAPTVTNLSADVQNVAPTAVPSSIVSAAEPGDDDLVGVQTEVVAETPAPSVLDAESWNAERTSLIQQIQAMRAEQVEISQRFTEKVKQIQHDSTKLAEQRAAFEQAQVEWRAERQQLAQQWLSRREQWDNLQPELTALISSWTERLNHAEELALQSHQPTAASAELLSLDAALLSITAHDSGINSEGSHFSLRSTRPAAAGSEPAEGEFIAPAVASRKLGGQALPEMSAAVAAHLPDCQPVGNAEREPATNVKPAAILGPVAADSEPRNSPRLSVKQAEALELTSFVSNRLATLELAELRRTRLLWIISAAVTLVMGAIAACVGWWLR